MDWPQAEDGWQGESDVRRPCQSWKQRELTAWGRVSRRGGVSSVSEIVAWVTRGWQRAGEEAAPGEDVVFG